MTFAIALKQLKQTHNTKLDTSRPTEGRIPPGNVHYGGQAVMEGDDKGVNRPQWQSTTGWQCLSL